MGKNNGSSWLNAVRKAFRSPSKVDGAEENDDEAEHKKRVKRKWMFLTKNYPLQTTIQHNAAKIRANDQNSKSKQAAALADDTSAIAAAMATAEAAVATARAAVDIIRLSTATAPYPLRHRHDQAALVIQTLFRGYLARRALMALKGIVKLQALIRAHIVRKRAKTALQRIESLVRVQTHFCDQRRRRSCEETTLPRNNKNMKSIVGIHSSTITNFSGPNSNKFFDLLLSQQPRISTISGDHGRRAVEEIQILIQRAKEFSFKQTKTTLGQVLFDDDQDQVSDNNYERRGGKNTRKSKTLCNLQVQSPRTPTSINVHSCSQTEEMSHQSSETPTSCSSIYRRRISVGESSCPLPRPNYMAATASAMARVRPHSTPRNRQSSPSREQSGHSSKKRLSFPSADDQIINTIHPKQPCYLTE
ncbi:protein IQ-DOMAIN 18-like isoform X1 [Andrographis paniculata]|uniref:protein IQ-DOMAIN 18-like isoform X1 n=1 Tax=Andrographis paniculata TaxID=175694 RepID=UPI0021E8952F|nr:protein IQ-DOMAIN 18-like isoform X1 [Andrographis paniculata]XP_051142468.1 protein IQ-DOMAIN 18-like isoform X1 [Andrographis paniculata]